MYNLLLIFINLN